VSISSRTCFARWRVWGRGENSSRVRASQDESERVKREMRREVALGKSVLVSGRGYAWKAFCGATHALAMSGLTDLERVCSASRLMACCAC